MLIVNCCLIGGSNLIFLLSNYLWFNLRISFLAFLAISRSLEPLAALNTPHPHHSYIFLHWYNINRKGCNCCKHDHTVTGDRSFRPRWRCIPQPAEHCERSWRTKLDSTALKSIKKIYWWSGGIMLLMVQKYRILRLF